MNLAELRNRAAPLSLLVQIHRLKPDNYIHHLARAKFHTDDWRNLPPHQLEQLRAILLSRRAAKERAAQAEKQQLKLSF